MRRPQHRACGIHHQHRLTRLRIPTVQHVARKDPGMPRRNPVGSLSIDPHSVQDSSLIRATLSGMVAQKQTNPRLPRFGREDRLLSFFLVFLVLMTVFVPMVGLSRPGRIAIDLVFALMLVSGAFATVHKRMLMYLIILLTILEFTADLIAEFNPSFSPRGWDT